MKNNCIDIIRLLIDFHNLNSGKFTLIEHSVGINWRVANRSTISKITNIEEGLIQHKPIQEIIISGKDIINASFNPSSILLVKENVISLSSKIKLKRKTHHLAIMNLHPDDDINYTMMLKMLRVVTNYMPGYLLKSGRYYHFYGNDLLNMKQWHKFMAQFLMPTLIVSPRYIGHCIYRGYAALRLTTNNDFKPHCPDLCDILKNGKNKLYNKTHNQLFHPTAFSKQHR
ncbi:MAG: hypothetical protein KKB34_18900 [Bacteroidetes bacterium]|nr:hypothetical protein [Bacteroidota bacterium]